jgi:hypothetical protein
MDWQTPEDTVPSAFITDANVRSLLGKPPATGAWREGDPVGRRKFVTVTDLALEFSGRLPSARIAYETQGTLNDDASNAILVAHALTGDSHIVGNPGNGHSTAGWWNDLVGPGKALDTNRWFVVSPNILGGCQGSTGPASHAPDGAEFGARFPFITIRDQVAAQVALSDALDIDRWAAVIGGSMAGCTRSSGRSGILIVSQKSRSLRHHPCRQQIKSATTRFRWNRSAPIPHSPMVHTTTPPMVMAPTADLLSRDDLPFSITARQMN